MCLRLFSLERGEVGFDLVVRVVFVFDLVVDAGDFLERDQQSMSSAMWKQLAAEPVVIPCEAYLLSPPEACLPDIWFYSNGKTSGTVLRVLALWISNCRYPMPPEDHD